MALFRCGAGAEKLQLEKGHYIAAKHTSAPSTGTYTSGTDIISGTGYGSCVVFAPNTSSTQITISSNQTISIAGLKDGNIVDAHTQVNTGTFNRTYNDCDLIYAMTMGGSGSNSITVTDL